MNAVSTFGDVEDSGYVHCRKLLLYYRRICSGLVDEHYLSMALAECKRDLFKYKTCPVLSFELTGQDLPPSCRIRRDCQVPRFDRLIRK